MDISGTEQDRDINAKLERLKELESKVKDIQAGNRQRVKKFIDRQKQKGKVQISALISKEAYEIINSFRDTSIKAGADSKALTASDIIEQALLLLNFHDNIKDSVKDNINVNVKQDKTELKTVDKLKTTPETPPAQPFLSLQGEIEPPAPFKIDIAEMPDKAIDITGFKTWLYGQILAMKQQGNSYSQIAERLNGAGVKTVSDKAFTRKNIERFFNMNK